MKAYVFDHGWEGAEIYFAPNKEKALAHFIADQTKYYDKEIEHHTKVNEPYYVEIYQREKAELTTSKFSNLIKEYDVKEGISIFTDGDN